MKKPKGFTILELLVVVAIIGLLAAPLYEGMRAIFGFWTRVSTDQESAAGLLVSIPELTTGLQSSKSVDDVSLANNTSGYIRYTDQYNRTITIFLNSVSNQSRFLATNTYPSSNLIATYKTGGAVSDPEVLMDGVTAFQLLTFTEHSSALITINNTVSSNKTLINAVQIAITRLKEGSQKKLEQLIVLDKTAYEKGGAQVYGSGDSPFADLSLNRFTFSNVETVLDGSGGLSDGVRLIPPAVQTVTIKNTGLYFSSIQEAINAAANGDTVLVGYRAEGYLENLSLKNKTNLTIQGGYDPKTWIRNIEAYSTKVSVKGGFSIDGITACFYLNNSHGCVIDGFDLSGSDLRYNIYIINSNNFKVIQSKIYDADRPILISNSSGYVMNNAVTSNEYALYVASVKQVVVQRNTFFAKDESGRDPAIRIENTSGLIMRNNLIKGGYDGVSIKNSTFVTFVNNVVDRPENFGIYFVTSTGQTVRNNAFCQGSIGLVMDYPEPGSFIDHNAFLYYSIRATQPAGRSSSSISSGVGSFSWETSNPYFENVQAYTLKTGSVLIDAGANSYSDTTQTPAMKGTAQNDIGAYGGGSSGRVGVGKITAISSSFTEGQISSAFSASYPGDFLHFGSGTFTLTQEYTLKSNQFLEGDGAINTLILHQGGGYVFRLGNGSSISYVRIKGTSSNKALIIPSGVAATCESLILQDLTMGIEAISAKSIMAFSSCYNTQTGIRLAGSTDATANFNIFANGSTGVLNEGTGSCTGKANVYSACSTHFSGVYSDSGTDKTQSSGLVFWDADAALFSLYPSSSAVAVSGGKSSGALEYFELKGFIQTPSLQSEFRRSYKKLEIKVGGLSGQKAPVSELQAALVIGSKTVTLSPTFILKTDEEKTPSWNLPATAFVKGLKIKVLLKSYVANRSAYVNQIIVRW